MRPQDTDAPPPPPVPWVRQPLYGTVQTDGKPEPLIAPSLRQAQQQSYEPETQVSIKPMHEL